MPSRIEKRCKECGETAHLESIYGCGNDKWFFVECDSCDNGTVRHYKKDSDAIKAWKLEYTLAEYHSSKGKSWGDVPSLCTGCEVCNAA